MWMDWRGRVEFSEPGLITQTCFCLIPSAWSRRRQVNPVVQCCHCCCWITPDLWCLPNLPVFDHSQHTNQRGKTWYILSCEWCQCLLRGTWRVVASSSECLHSRCTACCSGQMYAWNAFTQSSPLILLCLCRYTRPPLSVFPYCT